MKKVIFITILFQITFYYCFSKDIQWQKSFGGSESDQLSTIINTSDDGYIAVGHSRSNNGDVSGNHGEIDYWIVKINTEGSIQWQKTLGGSQWDIGTSIAQTFDGGYIISGISWSNDADVSENHGGYDYWLVKLNTEGSIEWQKSFGGSEYDGASTILQTKDGGYIVGGTSRSDDGDVIKNNGNQDYWILKLNKEGLVVWQRSFGGSSNDNLYSIIQSPDNDYIVFGSSESTDGDVNGNHGGYDIWIVKLNTEGSIEWQKSYGGSSSEQYGSIIQTNDGGYIFSGSSESTDGDVTGAHGDYDYWIVKLNTEGSIEWQKSFGGSEYDVASIILQTKDGGYIVGGTSRSDDGEVIKNNGNEDFWILKLNKEGLVSWQRSFGGSSNDYLNSIIQSSDNCYIVSGTSASNDGDVSGNHGRQDYWIVNLNIKDFLKPKSPSNLEISESNQSIILSWDRDTSENIKYNVYRSQSKNNNFSLTSEGITGKDGFTDYNVVNCNEYFYYIKAYDWSTNQESDPSDTVSATPKDLSELNNFITQVSVAQEKLTQLETLIDESGFDNLQKLFSDNIKKIVGDYNKGYSTDLAKSIMNSLIESPPCDLEKYIDVVLRFQMIENTLLECFNNEAYSIPGAKEIAYEVT
ncbi:MAG: hypothetical protein M1419_08705 [Bacteroidetes bacterium]|nr:hypothetical protein [Bacteroidota bacterium]